MNVALRPQSLNILSICTGGGGLDLGIELAIPGARAVCMVEREAFAVAHLVAAMEQGLLHPAAIWSDARTFDGRRWRGCVDGLIGGIPCQPHSLAGRKKGSLDERDLWSSARRIIVRSRPWFVLIENVAGMLSPGDDEVAGAERVWRDLRKLGFAVEIGLFTAAEVGASHERERLFILGVADPEREQRGAWRSEPGGAGRAHAEPSGPGAGVSGVGLADAYDEGSQGRRYSDYSGRRQGSERHAGLGGREMANAGGDGQQRRAEQDIGQIESEQQAPRRGDAERRDCDVVNASLIRRGEGRSEPNLRSGRNAASSTGAAVVNALDRGRGWRSQDEIGKPVGGTSDEGASGDVGLFPPGPGDIDAWREVLARAPELEPAFRRVADGLASRLDIARVDRLRMLGNGVVPLQAAHAFRTLATRLAGRGSAGAARLVRMMEAAE